MNAGETSEGRVPTSPAPAAPNPPVVTRGSDTPAPEGQAPASLHLSPFVAEASVAGPRPSWLRRGFFGAWKLWFGSVLSTFFVGSFAVVGWTARAARREALKTWWRRSPQRAAGGRFEDFAVADPATAEFARWPNWILGAPAAGPAAGTPPKPRRLHRLLGGLVANVKLGVPVAFNTWVLTLPGGLLWAVAWYAGWQNSFNKGYEHAWFGPTIFLLGMLLFSAAMLYVPLAQARQASTGDWRRFYDFRVVWRLVRRRWLAMLGVAFAWAFVSGIVLIVKLAPFLAQYDPKLTDLTPSAALKVSQHFFAFAALFLFPAFVALRLLAARVYAEGLRDAYQAGAVGEDALGEAEWHALRRLGLLTPQPAPERVWFVRLAAWLATRAGQVTAAAVVFAGWFVLSFFVTVSEFINKTEHGRGWWNQPMIQLPWFDYTPGRLRAAARQEHAAAEEAPTPAAAETP